ncbi:PAS domain S-box protein [Pseudomonas sp. 8Z]|uniref:PAS domain-containing sensor histidine kinase n=1 Tax=Pseudomonas sp. 8Z TaxID=2653166 RepID=UPI0012F147A4|nr:PAS domain-containing protein [Pseudomonas sp. 8Z]VXC96484.1 PAS domain S-box protein [Pseudomonas sp. 8Z]
MHTTDALLEPIWQSAPVGLGLLDLNGCLQRANPALLRMIGAPLTVPAPQPLTHWLHPQDRDALTHALARAGSQQADIPCGELRLRNAQDTYQWLRTSVSGVSAGGAEIDRFLIRLSPPRSTQERAELTYLLSFALDYTADGALLLDDALNIRYLNEAACSLLGQAQRYLQGQSIGQALLPLAHYSDEQLQELVQNQRALQLQLNNPLDGSHRYVSVKFTRFHYDRRGYSLALLHDLTEQQRLTEILQQNERQFRTLIENTHDAIGRVTPDFRLLYANPALEALCQLPLREAKGRSARDAFGNNSQVDIMADMVREVAQSGTAVEEELIHGIDGPSEQQLHYLVQLVPEYSANGEIVSVLSLGRDITSIRKAEKRLADSNQQLRELTSRRESAREEERKLIAQEIHDELGQHLTALRMGISMLHLQFGPQAPGLDDAANKLMGLCDRTIQVVRSIATSLRPAVLNMGLYPALEWLVEEFRQHTRIACELTTYSEEPALSDAQATTAFRIVQEALNNVARHSGATRTLVSLDRIDDGYRLDITDNGCGFDPSQANRRSLGLAGMRERGLSLGGEVVIFSHPGQGTTVQATLPVQSTQESS